MEPSKRRVVHRSPARKVWQLNLTHFQTEPIEAESSYERDFVYISALYPYCKRIQHQPFRMDLPSGKYTPDFRIDFQDASTAIVEVKPEEKSSTYAQTFAEAARQLEQHGVLFLVAAEDALYRNQRDRRARLIRRYAKSGYSSQEAAEILQLVHEAEAGISIGALTKRGIGLRTVFAMLAHRQLETTSDLAIDDEALVRPVQPLTETKHAHHFTCWLDVAAW